MGIHWYEGYTPRHLHSPYLYGSKNVTCKADAEEDESRSKDIVKQELQKLLTAGFIYPISDSKWVSPLVVVPKKVTRKWRICVDFRELNKATLKDYFPLPFIDQVLDTLSGK